METYDKLFIDGEWVKPHGENSTRAIGEISDPGKTSVRFCHNVRSRALGSSSRPLPGGSRSLAGASDNASVFTLM